MKYLKTFEETISKQDRIIFSDDNTKLTITHYQGKKLPDDILPLPDTIKKNRLFFQ